MSKEKIVMYAVGDCAPYRDDLDSSFKNVAGRFRSADLVFCQLESVLAEESRLSLSSCTRMGCSSKPEVAAVLKRSGFDVVSFASNHAMDYGRAAFCDTLKYLREAGLYVTGAGENETIARQYPIIDVKGTKVAVLAYGSILPQGFWAEEARPGVNPARGVTAYVPVEHDQPGTPCRIYTFPHPDDLKRMTKDIQEAKTKADVVITSFHWGIHFKEAILSDYERYYAHFAIDAGADAVIGHHQHILKPVEVYRGKPVFYGLSNFAMEDVNTMLQDQKLKGQDMKTSKSHTEMTKISDAFKTTTRCFPMDSYLTMAVRMEIEDGRITRAAWIPAYLPEDGSPVILDETSPRFNEIEAYMRRICEAQELPACWRRENGELVTVG